MIITFAIIVFGFIFLFAGVRKNIFYILYAMSMIGFAYWAETMWGWNVRPFSKNAFLLFLLFHLPLINIFTFLAYGRDKHCAKNNLWRIPEIHLHTLELLGGTIGAIIAQKLFHHKNKKKSYMATFFATITIQIGLIIYILKHFNFF